MNNLYFKAEEEKQQYIESISGLIGMLKYGIDQLEDARANGESLDNLVAKAEILNCIVHNVNEASQLIRDNYRNEEEILTYGQEKAIVGCLHNTAANVNRNGEYEISQGTLYDLNPWAIHNGEAIRYEFIKELQKIDLHQKKIEVDRMPTKIKK